MIVLELGQVGRIAVCDELALLLQLLGGAAHNVDVHGRQADGVVDCHILGGAVGRVCAQVQLWKRQPWARAGSSSPPLLTQSSQAPPQR